MSTNLDELEAMVAAATKGPWSLGPPHIIAWRSLDDQGRRTTRWVAGAVRTAPIIEGEREANAALIVAAVNALPKLIADLKAAREGLEEIGREQSAKTARIAADRFQTIARATLEGMNR